MKNENANNRVMVAALYGYAPYGVKFPTKLYDEGFCTELKIDATVHSVFRKFGMTISESYPIKCYVESNVGVYPLEDVKPYLRSVGNLAEWEKAEYASLCGKGGYDYDAENCSQLIDWCNAHYVDYRGLIPKGLALEAPADMYTDALVRLYDGDEYPEPGGIFPPMEPGPHNGEEELLERAKNYSQPK